MATIQDYFQNAELSVAAYANLQQGMQPNQYIDALGDAGMSAAEAREFVGVDQNDQLIPGKGYEIVTQLPNTSSGFSAAIFRKNGEYFLAIRGTENIWTNDGAIDWSGNIGDIGANGIAISQAIDLFNYFQDLTAQQGGTVYHYAYNQLTNQVTYTSAIASSTGALYGHGFTVTGHSLGGHLALIMSRLASNLVGPVYTYNAPGFDTDAITPSPFPGSEGFFTLLRDAEISARGASDILVGTWDTVNLHNLVVPEDIVHLIGYVPGAQLTQFSELGAVGRPIKSHDKNALTDALAVYSLLAFIDPAKTDAQLLSAGTNIFKAAANTPVATLEGVVNAMGDLFVSGTKVDVGNRDQLYQRLIALDTTLVDASTGALKPQYQGLSLAGLAGIDAPTIEANAYAALGYRYGLKHLNPFILVGNDTIYSQYDQNGELDVYDSATGSGTLTSQWISDRAKFLVWKVSINTDDRLFGLNTTAPANAWYQDKAVGGEHAYVLTQSVLGILKSDRAFEGFLDKTDAQRIFFGSDTAGDSLNGDANSDFLYGGGGDDRLNGLAQDDYLQGDAGDDLLAGGTGSDILIGGKDNDVLDGGLGNDTYIWNKGDGFDAITDAREADGFKQGGIQFLNQTLDGTKTQVSLDNSVEFSDGLGVTYQFFGPEGGEGTLFISKAGEAGDLEVRGFRSGDFGIDLGPVAAIQQTDKLGTADADNGADPGSPIYNDAPNEKLYGLDGDDGFLIATAGTEAYGGLGNDFIYAPIAVDDGGHKLYGEAGSDILISWSGSDQLFGGLDNDALSSGNEHDYLEGNEGSDVLASGLGQDVLIGGDGQDFLLGAGSYTATSGWSVTVNPLDNTVTFNQFNGEAFLAGDGGDVMKGEAGADFLWGGEGDDVLYGGTEDDYLEGDAGSDELFGENGNDTLWGDIANQNGADYLDGGAGDDVLFGQAGSDVLIGGDGADYLQADSEDGIGDGDDYLDGGAGNDQLVGGGGADDSFGGDGDDQLWGEAGDDYLDGEGGADQLSGSDGNDVLFGGAGADLLKGDLNSASGDDYLDGEDGNDTIAGGGGSDVLYGGADDDQLFGDADDVAVAEHGNDTMSGGLGADYLRGYGGDDVLSGDEGNDTLQGEAGNDVLSGGDGDDILFGDADADVLAGGEGNDWLQGGIDNDMLSGDSGDDVLFGEQGADNLEGGAGFDYLVGGDGNDQLNGGGENDVLFGEAGNDILVGGTGNDRLVGGDGNDMMDGGNDDDILWGDSGNDTLIGGAGNDYLISGMGDDVLAGGDGDDVYFYGSGEGIDHISDSGGIDWLVFQNGITLQNVQLGVGSLKLTLSDGGEVHLDDFDPDDPLAGAIEYIQFSDGVAMTREQLIQTLGFHVEGTPGDDVLSGTAFGEPIYAYAGNDSVDARGGDDRVFGDGGNDSISGGFGNDILDGGDGSDILHGDAGDDRLLGGAGDDVLAGGVGNDTLEGGEGNDVYLFGAGDGQDVAIDTSGIDAVQLTGGLSESEITMRRVGSDLVIGVNGTTGRLTVQGWFGAEGNFGTLTLGDGTVLDRAGVEARLVLNQAPFVTEDMVSAKEDTLIQVSGNALANDADPEGRALRITNPGTYTGAYGMLALTSNGAYSYTLNNASAAVQSLAAGQTVTENFGYTVTDDDPAGAATASSAIVVNVAGTNDAPVVLPDAAAVSEDGVLFASGNVLANDSDIDAGTTLRVTSTGTIVSAYGSATLTADGTFTYTLNNAASAVQSLGRTQQVTERFHYTVSDGFAGEGAELDVMVAGANDAPVVNMLLADQTAAANSAWSWQLPAGSFTDIDYGDVLAYRAELTDGAPLPTWLSFDSATQTFSGRVPRDASGYLDINVIATDSAPGAGSESNLSAADVFRLSFASTNGGGTGGSSQGDAGVGNGVDAPPPGQDYNFNDGAGTSPGNPGAQDGYGYQPQLPAAPGAALVEINLDVPGHMPPRAAAAIAPVRPGAQRATGAPWLQNAGGAPDAEPPGLSRTPQVIDGVQSVAQKQDSDTTVSDQWFDRMMDGWSGRAQNAAAQDLSWLDEIVRAEDISAASGAKSPANAAWLHMHRQLTAHLAESANDESADGLDLAALGTAYARFAQFSTAGSGSVGVRDSGAADLRSFNGLKEGLARIV